MPSSKAKDVAGESEKPVADPGRMPDVKSMRLRGWRLKEVDSLVDSCPCARTSRPFRQRKMGRVLADERNTQPHSASSGFSFGRRCKSLSPVKREPSSICKLVVRLPLTGTFGRSDGRNPASVTRTE